MYSSVLSVVVCCLLWHVVLWFDHVRRICSLCWRDCARHVLPKHPEEVEKKMSGARCRMTCLLIGTTLFNDSSVRWYVPTTKPIPHYVGEGTTCAKINCRIIGMGERLVTKFCRARGGQRGGRCVGNWYTYTVHSRRVRRVKCMYILYPNEIMDRTRSSMCQMIQKPRISVEQSLTDLWLSNDNNQK